MNSRLNEILGSEPTAEEVEFRRNVSMWWKLVYKPGYCVELRMLDDKNGATSSGYYDCFESFFDVVERCNAKANIYTTITLNT